MKKPKDKPKKADQLHKKPPSKAVKAVKKTPSLTPLTQGQKTILASLHCFYIFEEANKIHTNRFFGSRHIEHHHIPKVVRIDDESYILSKLKPSDGLEHDNSDLDEVMASRPPKFKALRHVGKRLAFVGLGAILPMMLLQLLYPKDMVLPLSRVQSYGLQGFANKDKMLSSFSDFDTRVVTVHTHTKNITTTYKDIGVTVDPEATIAAASNYPLKERLIPFSMLYKSIKPTYISRDLDEKRLQLFVTDVISIAGKQPVDAVVTLDGTTLKIQDSSDGFEYQLSELKSQILKSDLGADAQIVFAPTILNPDISTDVARGAVKAMQARLNNPIVISGDDKTFTVDSRMMASWLEIIPKVQEHKVDLIFNKDKVRDSLRPFSAQVNISSVNTVLTQTNGMFAGRTNGSVGKSLQFDDLVQRVSELTSPTVSTLEANVDTILPGEITDRTYTRDSIGAQSLLDYWTANNRGQYGIDLRSINGRIEANINPHRLFPSIGVYRIYIASIISGMLSSGSINNSTMTSSGVNVAECLERMMVSSDESCSNALGKIVGWSSVDYILSQQGFESTTLTEGAGLTSANDTSDWMSKLLASNITTTSQANTLQNMMTRQIFRTGIPAGSNGIVVADKAGAFGRYRHDVAIVNHPKGKYVLSILSEGSDAKLIADLTSQINRLMDQ